MSFSSWEVGYDRWKTACCGNYPHCHPCPHDDDGIDWDEMDEEIENEEEVDD